MTRADVEPVDGRVSIVIPTRDRSELLRQTLRSLSEQTAPPAEIIVADDGSTDDTERVVREAGALRIHNPGGGWGAAGGRNAGLARVSTEFVAFVDSDDLLLPGALEALTGVLSAAPAAPFAYGQGLAARAVPGGWVAEGLIRPDPDELERPLQALFARNSVPSSGTLVRTTVIRDVGGYDERVEWIEDHHLWLRLARRGAPAYVDELVCVHRRHAGNRHTPLLAAAEAKAIRDMAIDDPRLVGCLPERLGVELCEVAISILRERPLRFPATVHALVRGRRGKRTILSRCARHWTARRRWGRAGDELLAARPDLRRWLSSYR